MIQRFPRNHATLIFIFSLLLVWAFLFPLTVVAEPRPTSCPNMHQQIEETQQTLRALEQQQQQLQQQVRATYQELFACQAGSGRSTAQHHHCTQLAKEGPNQFQAMIEAITLQHQRSQQLAHQTRQAQLTCPVSNKNTFPQTTQLLLSPTN
ncbi:MAG: hypothetical protein OEZ57_12035 [Nitrospirota bacterium]|nr:hypothetical protein [Nitrospirota bacterium]